MLVRLILALLALAAAPDAPEAPQEPPAPPGHRARVAQLLHDREAYEPGYWINTLFQSMTRLEHAPPAELLPAWQALAEVGGQVGLANLVLYCRRHGLPLPDEQVGEGADPALERALAAWGAQDLERAGTLLRRGLRLWPEDSRWEGNVGWLELRPPPLLAADATSRELALAVLAARSTQE